MVRAVSLRLTLLACLLFTAIPARGDVQPRDFVPARAVALPASRAIATGNEAIFVNPAGLAAAQRYTIQMDYSLATGRGANAIVLSLADSVSNPQFATGIAYRYLSTEEGNGYQGWMTDVALGVPVLGLFMLGTRLSYMDYTAHGRNLKRFTGDVGFLVPIGPVMIGGTGFNLINVDSPEAPRGFAAGLAFGDDRTFRIAADLRYEWIPNDANAFRALAVAGEHLLMGAFPLRVGYEWDDLRGTQFLTAGVGALLPPVGADVSARYDMKSGVYQWIFALKLFVA